jgi:hypothetical protein
LSALFLVLSLLEWTDSRVIVFGRILPLISAVQIDFVMVARKARKAVYGVMVFHIMSGSYPLFLSHVKFIYLEIGSVWRHDHLWATINSLRYIELGTGRHVAVSVMLSPSNACLFWLTHEPGGKPGNFTFLVRLCLGAPKSLGSNFSPAEQTPDFAHPISILNHHVCYVIASD